MGHERKQQQDEAGPSAPLWMVTFSDCMNLLLTFFVLLVTFSSFDTKVLTNLGSVFRRILPGISFTPAEAEMDKSDFLPTTQLMSVEAHAKGSEKPTLARGPQDNLEQETQPADFRTRKVFLIDSEDIFWGKGTSISSNGKKTLGTMALFLKELPSRVVISEHVLDSHSGELLGLQRAWAVVEYLTTKQGLNKNRFSISAVTTLSDELQNPKSKTSKLTPERTLEIVLLERSIHN